MKTKNFTVTVITIHSSYDIVPSIDIEVRAESLDFANGNKVVTAEKLKDIMESKLNSTFSVVPPIKKVIFNNPATIVIWEDGTKTVVKCSKDDTFSEYAGLSMCITKKLLGNNFKKEMNKWCNKPDPVEKKPSGSPDFSKVIDAANHALEVLHTSLCYGKFYEEAAKSLDLLCVTLDNVTKNYKSAK